jgi:UDP-glucuronate 4-epimerase
MRVIVTGSAGFIGSALVLRLLERGDDVLGIDNLSDYYDVDLKRARLARHLDHARYQHVHADLADRAAIDRTFAQYQPERVVNLAAQAGVRYAMQNPHVYVSSNVTGFLHILENCRHHRVEHLVYASTSSVYGANTALPFSVHASTEHPLTLYAATKKANEMMAHSYAYLYGIPCTGLRFFTVYGPWGRPDMAFFLFTKAILAGEPVRVFNEGRHTRDFTYVDDIVEGVLRTLDRVPNGSASWSGSAPDPATSTAPYRIYNIGSQASVPLLRYIELLEESLGKRAKLELLPLQAGDVLHTEADVSDLVTDVCYRPQTSVETGVRRFVEWYRDYFRV